MAPVFFLSDLKKETMSRSDCGDTWGPDGFFSNGDSNWYTDGKETWRHDRRRSDWINTPIEEQKIKHGQLSKHRSIGSPAALKVVPDEHGRIFTNLVWNIGESPEIARVINPTTKKRLQISFEDLNRPVFKQEDAKDPADGTIKIIFDHAGNACDNDLAISDECKIHHHHATVLNILRSIKAMTRMYPSTDPNQVRRCRSQQHHFMYLGKVEQGVWKVKGSPTSQ